MTTVVATISMLISMSGIIGLGSPFIVIAISSISMVVDETNVLVRSDPALRGEFNLRGPVAGECEEGGDRHRGGEGELGTHRD